MYEKLLHSCDSSAVANGKQLLMEPVMRAQQKISDDYMHFSYSFLSFSVHYGNYLSDSLIYVIYLYCVIHYSVKSIRLYIHFCKCCIVIVG